MREAPGKAVAAPRVVDRVGACGHLAACGNAAAMIEKSAIAPDGKVDVEDPAPRGGFVDEENPPRQRPDDGRDAERPQAEIAPGYAPPLARRDDVADDGEASRP